MFGLGSLLGVVGDVTKVITAPVTITAELTRVVTEPLAEVAEDIVKSVKEEIR